MGDSPDSISTCSGSPNSVSPSVPIVEYYPDHPLIQQLNNTCSNGTLQEVQELIAQWKSMPQPSSSHGPMHNPMSRLDPVLHTAIKANRVDIVAYLLDQGIRVTRKAAWEAVKCKCSSALWQVLFDHGLDINEPLDDALCPPPLAYVLPAP